MRVRRAVRRVPAGAGFTLIEAVLALGLLSIVLGGVLQVALRSQGAMRESVAQMRLLQKSRRVIDRVATELAAAGRTTVTPPLLAPLGGSTIDFQETTGYVGGAIQRGPVVRFTFEYVPGELDNGLDDNGDGLIDEGQLVRIIDPTGAPQRAVLIHGVSELAAGETANGLDDNGDGLIDEGGVSFQIVGNELRVQLTVEQPALDNLVDRVTQVTSVALINP